MIWMRSGSAGLLMQTKFSRPETCMTHLPIFANCSVQPLAKMTSPCSNTTSYATRRQRREKIKVVEIPVDCTINFDWSHSNLKHGIRAGEDAAKRAYEEYLRKVDDPGQR